MATALLNEDPVPEIITAPGPGGRAVVKIFDGFTRQLIQAIHVHPKFRGGLNIAVGDVLPDAPPGDNRLELLVSFDKGGPPDVLIFDPDTGARMHTLRVYDAKFKGGVRLALGQFNPISQPQELYVTPGPGAPALAKVFDVPTRTLLHSITVGGNKGAFIATAPDAGGDILIVGAGAGAPRVRVFAIDGTLLNELTVPAKGGVRVATAQLRPGGSSEIIAASGPGGSLVTVFDIGIYGQFRPFGRKAKTGFFVAGGVRDVP